MSLSNINKRIHEYILGYSREFYKRRLCSPVAICIYRYIPVCTTGGAMLSMIPTYGNICR